MAQEEFQESDIVFEDNAAAAAFLDGADTTRIISEYVESRSNGKLKRKKKSVPVKIPENYMDSDSKCECNDVNRDGRFIPPHLILGRRITGKMAFSVYSGDGRTLKGRHLNDVRDCIMRMTGFLET